MTAEIRSVFDVADERPWTPEETAAGMRSFVMPHPRSLEEGIRWCIEVHAASNLLTFREAAIDLLAIADSEGTTS